MFIGIDTSNYTTSLASYDGQKMISLNKLLRVPYGKIGMRQSECFFHHMESLGELFDDMKGKGSLKDVEVIGVSSRPRRMEDSYMPVFLAGVQTAKCLSSVLNVPLYSFSHQEGHIMAALLSNEDDFWKSGQPFLFLHLSGGTTEFLKCHFIEDGFSAEILGNTSDISAGQLIDRVGVKMGLSFPSGKYMEELAEKADDFYELPVTVNRNMLSFSGCEAEVFRIMERENYDWQALSKSLFQAIIQAIIQVFSNILENHPLKYVVIAGGVASSSYVRNELNSYLTNMGKQVLFAKKEYSSDNAAGIAALAMQRSHLNGK